MKVPGLLLVVHGSTDPRAAASAAALTDQVAARRPAVPVRLAYFDHHAPDPITALGMLPDGPVVVLPLLLAQAFHATRDVQALVDQARAGGRPVAVVPALGDDPLLLQIATDLLQRAGVAATVPVVLASAGTTHEAANTRTAAFAAAFAGHRGTPVVSAYASAAEPTVPQAIASLGGRVAVLRWLLAPGRFADAVAADARAAGCVFTDVLMGSEHCAALVVRRYDELAATLPTARDGDR